ncbi:hypothetical protein Agub_g6295, partial [Astrephomene gubernaculifera]
MPMIDNAYEALLPALLTAGVALVALLHLTALLLERAAHVELETPEHDPFASIPKSVQMQPLAQARAETSETSADTAADSAAHKFLLREANAVVYDGGEEAPGTPGRDPCQAAPNAKHTPKDSLHDKAQGPGDVLAPPQLSIYDYSTYRGRAQTNYPNLAAWHQPEQLLQRHYAVQQQLQQVLPRLRLGSLPHRRHKATSGNLKQPRGLANCVISEDMPYPPANAEVTLEVRSTTVRHGRKLLRYWASSPLDTIYVKIPHTSPSLLHRPLLDSLRHTIELPGQQQRVVVGAGVRPGCVVLSLDVLSVPPGLRGAAAAAAGGMRAARMRPAAGLAGSCGAEAERRTGAGREGAATAAGEGEAGRVTEMEDAEEEEDGRRFLGGGRGGGGLHVLAEQQLSRWLEAMGVGVSEGMRVSLQYGGEVVQAVYDERRAAWTLSADAEAGHAAAGTVESRGGGSGDSDTIVPPAPPSPYQQQQEAAVQLTLAKQVLVAPAAAGEQVRIAVRAHGLPYDVSDDMDAGRYTFVVRGLGRHFPVLGVAAPTTPTNLLLYGDCSRSSYDDSAAGGLSSVDGGVAAKSAAAAAGLAYAYEKSIAAAAAESAGEGSGGGESRSCRDILPRATPPAHSFELTVGGLGGGGGGRSSSPTGPLRLQVELWYDNTRMIASKSVLLLPSYDAELAELVQDLIRRQVCVEERETAAAVEVAAAAVAATDDAGADAGTDALVSDLAMWFEFMHDTLEVAAAESAAANAEAAAEAATAAAAAAEPCSHPQHPANGHPAQQPTAASTAAAPAVILPGSIDLREEVLAARRRHPAFAGCMLDVGLGLLESAVGLGCSGMAARFMGNFVVLGYGVAEVWHAVAGGAATSLLHSAAASGDAATLRLVAAWAAEVDAGAGEGDRSVDAASGVGDGGSWWSRDSDGLTPLHLLTTVCFDDRNGGDADSAAAEAAEALEWVLSFSDAAQRAWTAATADADGGGGGMTPRQLLAALLAEKEQQQHQTRQHVDDGGEVRYRWRRRQLAEWAAGGAPLDPCVSSSHGGEEAVVELRTLSDMPNSGGGSSTGDNSGNCDMDRSNNSGKVDGVDGVTPPAASDTTSAAPAASVQVSEPSGFQVGASGSISSTSNVPWGLRVWSPRLPLRRSAPAAAAAGGLLRLLHATLFGFQEPWLQQAKEEEQRPRGNPSHAATAAAAAAAKGMEEGEGKQRQCGSETAWEGLPPGTASGCEASPFTTAGNSSSNCTLASSSGAFSASIPSLSCGSSSARCGLLQPSAAAAAAAAAATLTPPAHQQQQQPQQQQLRWRGPWLRSKPSTASLHADQEPLRRPPPPPQQQQQQQQPAGGESPAQHNHHHHRRHQQCTPVTSSPFRQRRQQQQPPQPQQRVRPCRRLESSYQSYLTTRSLGVCRCWCGLHLLLLAAALRRLRSEGAALAEFCTPVAYSAAYAGMLVVMHARPGAGLYLPRRGPLWALVGLLRTSTKTAQLAGWLHVPAATLVFVRRGITLLPDAILPALCEPCPLPYALLVTSYDLVITAAFYLHIGYTGSLPRAVVLAGLKAVLALGVRLAVDAVHRAAFLRE